SPGYTWPAGAGWGQEATLCPRHPSPGGRCPKTSRTAKEPTTRTLAAPYRERRTCQGAMGTRTGQAFAAPQLPVARDPRKMQRPLACRCMAEPIFADDIDCGKPGGGDSHGQRLGLADCAACGQDLERVGSA